MSLQSPDNFFAVFSLATQSESDAEPGVQGERDSPLATVTSIKAGIRLGNQREEDAVPKPTQLPVEVEKPSAPAEKPRVMKRATRIERPPDKQLQIVHVFQWHLIIRALLPYAVLIAVVVGALNIRWWRLRKSSRQLLDSLWLSAAIPMSTGGGMDG